MAGNRKTGSGDGYQHIHTPDFLSDDVLLKPKLDTIFAEVESSLPSIDFEISDVSSEEEAPIFHRSLKTPTFDDDQSDKDFEGTFDFRQPAKLSPPIHIGYASENKMKYDSFDNKYSGAALGLSKSSPTLSKETILESADISTAIARMESELGVNSNECFSQFEPKSETIDMSNDMSIAFSRMGNELGVNLNDVFPQLEPKTETADMSKDMNIALARMGNELGINLNDAFSTNFINEISVSESKSSPETKLKASEADMNLTKTQHRTSRPAGPKRKPNDTPIDENTIELEITSPPVSPRSEKRREIPELSPNRSESGDEEKSEESPTISGALKQKGQSVKTGNTETKTTAQKDKKAKKKKVPTATLR